MFTFIFFLGHSHRWRSMRMRGVSISSLFSVKEPLLRAAVLLPCLQNAWKWLKMVININISLCIKSAPSLLREGLSCSANCAQLSAYRWKEKQGALEMGEVERGSEKRGSKGYREKKGKREIQLSSSTGFFLSQYCTPLSKHGSEGSPSTENEWAEGRQKEQRKMCWK